MTPGVARSRHAYAGDGRRDREQRRSGRQRERRGPGRGRRARGPHRGSCRSPGRTRTPCSTSTSGRSPWSATTSDHDAALDELEWDRTYGAYVPDRGGEALAGMNSTFTLRLPVPGGEIDAGGLTWVGVHPQFRRRGVLTAMIRDHLAAGPRPRRAGLRAARLGGHDLRPLRVRHGGPARDDGSSAAAPSCATSPARTRSACGSSASTSSGTPTSSATASRPPAPASPASSRATRPASGGACSTTSSFTRRRTGVETLRILVAEADDGGPARGYALFRRKHDWSGASPNGTVLIRELVARDPAAAHALWSRLLDLDLMSTVELSDRPLDDPLLSMLADPRSAKPVVVDGIWVRLVDLPAALAARRYTTDVDVVLEVTDALCPWNAGRWHLTGGPDGAACRAGRRRHRRARRLARRPGARRRLPRVRDADAPRLGRAGPGGGRRRARAHLGRVLVAGEGVHALAVLGASQDRPRGRPETPPAGCPSAPSPFVPRVRPAIGAGHDTRERASDASLRRLHLHARPRLDRSRTRRTRPAWPTTPTSARPHEAVIRGGERALPDGDGDHGPRHRRQGRRHRHHRRPVRGDQGGPQRLLPARLRRPRRGGQGRRADPGGVGRRRSRCARS